MKKIFLMILGILIISSAYSQDKQQQALKHFNKGKELFENADHTSSITSLRKAQKIYEEEDDKAMTVLCKGMICHNLVRRGEINEAIESMAQVMEQTPEELPIDVRVNLHNILGEAYLNKGRLDLAQESLDKALKIGTDADIGKTSELSDTYNNLGLVYWNTGKWDESLDYLFRSANIRKEIYGTEHPATAAVYNNLGLVYTSKGELDKALDYYQNTLNINKKIYGDNHLKVANNYINIAIIHAQNQDYSKALGDLEKATKIWEIQPKENQTRIAFAYINIGQVYFEQREYLLALEYQKNALKLYENSYGNKHPETANTYNYIGDSYLERGDFKTALSSFQSALNANIPDFDQTDYNINPKITTYYNSDVLLNSLHLKAKALEGLYVNKTLKVKNLQAALECLESADGLIANIRRLRNNKNDKIRLGELAAEVYEDAIRVCLTLSEVTLKKKFYQRKAFYFCEKSKSAVLLAAINDTDAKEFAGIPSELLEDERKMKEEIAFLEQELAKGPTPEIENKLRDELFNQNQNYQKFIESLEQKFPNYYNLKYNAKSLSIEDIQASLDEGAELLSYFLASQNQRIYLFKISKKDFQVYNIPQSERFRFYLIGLRNAIQYRSSASYYKHAYALYKQLFPTNIHRNIQKLIIIPDGRLGSIPFEALIMKNPERAQFNGLSLPYVIQKYEVSYNFSATLFVQTQQKASSESTTNQAAMLFAPIEFKSSRLNSLPGTNDEVDQIQALFNQNNLPVQLYKRDNANEQTLKSIDLTKYAFIHFATHGLVDEINPELSRIFLYHNQETDQEDGQLYSGEIYNFKFEKPLVILSACETGLGKISRGEGIIGLSRALLYAGAKDILVSLWSVSDMSTSELMIDFYKNILKNNKSQIDLSSSLREAKLKMINNSKYNLPYYWAPFIMIGN